MFRLLRDLERAFGVYQWPEFDVKHYHYYTRKDARTLVQTKFRIIYMHGDTYCFPPRVAHFFANPTKTCTVRSRHDRLRRLFGLSDRLLEMLQTRFQFVGDFSHNRIGKVRMTIRRSGKGDPRPPILRRSGPSRFCRSTMTL